VSPPSNNGPQIADDLRWYIDRPCYYCGRPMRKNHWDRPTRDHIDPHEVDPNRGRAYVVCCRLCNHMKGNLTQESFLAQCRHIAILHSRQDAHEPPPPQDEAGAASTGGARRGS